MKNFSIPFGKEKITFSLPDEQVAGVLLSHAHEYKAPKSEAELVADALANPIGSPKLSELAKGKKTCTIISSDHTRPVPSHVIMPQLLAELRKGNPDIAITILIATGMHRPTTHEELVAKYGKEIADHETFVIHDSRKDEDMVRDYLNKILRKEAFDRSGLIYGMGHAVYSISDPRARIFKSFVKELATETHHSDEFELYSMIERIAPEVIGQSCHIYKGVSANVDFYSGFVYSMLDIPLELYTPIFAIARIVGWSAHRIEELINVDKIIRPAYKSIMVPKVYESISKRNLKINTSDDVKHRITMK